MSDSTGNTWGTPWGSDTTVPVVSDSAEQVGPIDVGGVEHRPQFLDPLVETGMSRLRSDMPVPR